MDHSPSQFTTSYREGASFESIDSVLTKGILVSEIAQVFFEKLRILSRNPFSNCLYFGEGWAPTELSTTGPKSLSGRLTSNRSNLVRRKNLFDRKFVRSAEQESINRFPIGNSVALLCRLPF